MVVLVSGASGQLGQSLRHVAGCFPEIDFVFCNSNELDITDQADCESVFARIKPDYCINTAAYTAVDKAESEPEKAASINVTGAKNLAVACKKSGSILLHISTDFVFDGKSNTPYTEESQTNPLSVYGRTKLEGEQAISETLKKHFIVRTSWVYSQFGQNFMKTMLRLGQERDSVSIVSDQMGTPTNAIDLAEILVKIIMSCTTGNPEALFGTYHFSGEGQCSWYDFAKKIFEANDIKIAVHPIQTKAYPTQAKRPAYSVLSKAKIKAAFGIEIKNWEESLKK